MSKAEAAVEVQAQAIDASERADPPRAFATGDAQEREGLRDVPLRSSPHPSRLDAPLQSLRGAGPRLAATAREIGIESVGDLLWHLPHGYRDRTALGEVAELKLGEESTLLVEVRKATLRRPRRRRLTILEATVADESGPMKAVWFNQPWLEDKLVPGARLLIHGKLDKSGFRVDTHELVENGEGGGAARAPAGLHTMGIVPVHPATEGIKPQRLREWAFQAQAAVRDAIEPLPARIRAGRRLAAVGDALAAAHFPASDQDVGVARHRLAFEELLLHQAALASRRSEHDSSRSAIPIDPPGELVSRWVESLPFELTADQKHACEEIEADLSSKRPMQRLLMGEVGSGKAQPLDSLVLTPSGFRRMGDIQPGDEVINPTGQPTTVVGVFPQGLREVWRVRFSDGTSVKCDGDHLWSVRTSQARYLGRTSKVKTLREISTDLRGANGSPKWHVELPAAAELDGGDERPIDPYLLGLILGDGGLSVRDRVRFTSADSELVESFRRALPPGCEMRRETHRPYDWKIIGARAKIPAKLLRAAQHDDPSSMARLYEAGASQAAIASRTGLDEWVVRRSLLAKGVSMRTPYRKRSELAEALDSLGLMGKTAREKAVPEVYLNASIADRHAVLQGLMDTDGTLSKQGINVTFTSASQQLAEDVAWLVRSLGGRARCRSIRKAGGTYWLTSLILPEEYPPFRLGRKASLLRPRTKYAHRAKAIVSVEPIGRKPVQCIAVAHPNQLYITDGFTVTHNTVVALFAMLAAVEAGHQAALMAPTETLAEQHFATLERLLAGTELPRVALLTSSTPAASRRELLGHLDSGQLDLVVGTHALIEPEVEFARLALVVVDEQHRFGVRQRAALDAKGPGKAAPHALHMTATPIPRTLSLTAYGDLDTTVLRELPAGRRPVKTWVVGEEKRSGAYEFVRERLREGRQAYVVCPLVTESEKLQARAATEEGKRLAKTEFRDFEVAILHGQMPAARKAEAMEGFASGRTDVLVATSVVEVGIDVANAAVMVIEEADRYGLSQLHQLRGRVGRGEHESACILFGDPQSEAARLRLDAISSERDGFKLAEVDLGIRGEGEILGTRQHGLPRFRVATLPEDAALLMAARDEVLTMLRDHGDLEAPELGPLMDAARRRFGDERAEPIAA